MALVTYEQGILEIHRLSQEGKGTQIPSKICDIISVRVVFIHAQFLSTTTKPIADTIAKLVQRSFGTSSDQFCYPPETH